MKHIAFITLFCITLTGCATTPQVANIEPLPRPVTAGIYHRVVKGETLWRIAKSYNVEISRIAQANRLRDPSRIEVGQMLFVPGAAQKTVVYTRDFPAKPGKKGFIWPVKGRVISYFGQKRYNTVNNGIDILSSENALVVASKSGVVSFCDDKVKGFGKTIIIEHDDGYSTVYAYNSQNLVRAGERVKSNQAIAKVGKSSRSDRYALHFEIRKRHKPVNPFYYLP